MNAEPKDNGLDCIGPLVSLALGGVAGFLLNSKVHYHVNAFAFIIASVLLVASAAMIKPRQLNMFLNAAFVLFGVYVGQLIAEFAH